MSYLTNKDKAKIKKSFKMLNKEIQLIHFTQDKDCQYCFETKLLLQELSSLSDKIELLIFNYQIDSEIAKKFKIDKVPATVIMAEKDAGIRYYGIPSGYEFSSLIDDIVDVSKNESGLMSGTKKMLSKIKKPMQLIVFVTPTCPHCPVTVRLAYKIALENQFINTDVVEATEFPNLTIRYGVKDVPKTIISEKTFFEGIITESEMVTKLIEVYNEKYN